LFLRNLRDFDLVSIPGILGFKFVRVSERKWRLKERLEDMGADVKEWTALVSQEDGTGRDTVVGRLREGRDAKNGGICASITTGPSGNEPGASTLRCHHTSGNHQPTFVRLREIAESRTRRQARIRVMHIV
jgi:hypothetical protein